MKKVLRYFLYFVVILIVAIGGMVTYVKSALPNVGPPPELSIELTSERIARGKYLANHVMQCVDCHAQRDFSLFGGPPMEGTIGKGGDLFDQSMGFPGKFVARNITPHGIGNWTDGELFRAITTGVSKDGSALFPIMPYEYFGKCDPEDIKAVIAYLRTLEPINSTPEASVPDFPFNIILNTLPSKQQPVSLPGPSDRLAYGKYMTTAAVCGECHTKKVKGEVVGEPFAGGFEFDLGAAILRSPNITPHETGIGAWTKDQFIDRFKQYADSSYTPHKVKEGEFQTVMPWLMYAGMDDYDLGAIYDYLKTLTPVNNEVNRWEAKK
jgi:mono/diheme cytochrome c family protein